VQCQRNKASNKPPIGLLQPLEIPEQRWQTVSMDFVGPLPRTPRDHDAIMVVVDKLTKRVVLHAMAMTDTATDVAQHFFDRVFRNFGLPERIISDRDTRFTSAFWQQLWKLLGTQLAMSTAFHPQTDGQTERINRLVQEILRAYVSYAQDNWDLLLAAVEFAINNTQSRITGMTPFMMDTGRDPRTPSLETVDTPVESVHQFLERLQNNITFARNRMIHEQQKSADHHNESRREKEFQPGDQVLLQRQHVTPPALRDQPSTKLQPKYIGPYKIIKKVGENAYELELPPNINIHPVINVERLREFQESPAEFGDRGEDRPPAIDVQGAPEFEVEQILKSRTRGGHTEYLVLWKGYPMHEATWEPEDHLDHAEEAIADFELSQRQQAQQYQREHQQRVRDSASGSTMLRHGQETNAVTTAAAPATRNKAVTRAKRPPPTPPPEPRRSARQAARRGSVASLDARKASERG
jgi:transposase InsO family protein